MGTTYPAREWFNSLCLATHSVCLHIRNESVYILHGGPLVHSGVWMKRWKYVYVFAILMTAACTNNELSVPWVLSYFEFYGIIFYIPTGEYTNQYQIERSIYLKRWGELDDLDPNFPKEMTFSPDEKYFYPHKKKINVCVYFSVSRVYKFLFSPVQVDSDMMMIQKSDWSKLKLSGFPFYGCCWIVKTAYSNSVLNTSELTGNWIRFSHSGQTIFTYCVKTFHREDILDCLTGSMSKVTFSSHKWGNGTHIQVPAPTPKATITTDHILTKRRK